MYSTLHTNSMSLLCTDVSTVQYLRNVYWCQYFTVCRYCLLCQYCTVWFTYQV